MSFSLTREPWIPVSMVDGSARTVSLREAFAQADEIRRIEGDIPTQPPAMLRLLLAICHAAIGIRSKADVARAIEHGLDAQAIEAYLDRYEERFDLFHPERPFYQVAGLRTGKGEVAGLEKIVADIPNRIPYLSVRSARSVARIGAAEAARWLIHTQAFDPSGIRSGAVGDPLVTGGKGYPIGPAWVGQLGVVVLHGTSLAQTLTLNLVPLPESSVDRPVWEAEQSQTAQREMEAVPSGPLSVLTWQSRRMRLVGDADGVTGVVLAQGDQLKPQNRQRAEFMTAWRYSKPQTAKFGTVTYMPLKHDPERSTWRGLPALLGVSKGNVDGSAATLPPRTLAALAENEELENEDADLSVVVETIGLTYGAQEAIVDELVHDVMDVRISLLGESAVQVRDVVSDAVALADGAVRVLGKLGANLTRAAGDHDGTDGALERAKRAGWSALDVPARMWIAELSAETDPVEAMRTWQSLLREVVEAEIHRHIASVGPAAVTGRKTAYGFMNADLAQIYARRELRTLLPAAYPTKKEEE